MSEPRWLPLESNPDVMNKFLANVGVSSDWQIVDVLGLDDDLLAMVPQPVLALLLLFPTSEDLPEDGKSGNSDESGAFFVRQTIRNACGTIALIHAIGNNTDKLNFNDGSTIKQFVEATKSMTPVERAKALEGNKGLSAAHESCAVDGQTSAPSLTDEVNYHFVALVNRGGQLLELDGRKSAPVTHGATSDGTFLADAVRVCREFMSKDPENVNFAVVALAKPN